jgi:hypothetical protein
VIVVIFIALELWHSHKTMYNTFMAFAAGAAAIAFLRRDVIQLMLTSTLSSPPIFFLLLSLLFLYPKFVHGFYNIPNLLGIYILGVPIEELFFAATGGALWSVAYECVQSYGLACVLPLSLLSPKETENIPLGAKTIAYNPH